MDNIDSNKDSCTDIEKLKKKYEKLKPKYNLPSFKELNEEFDISKIDCDTETILRDIRKMMTTKFSSALNFIELLLNPTTGSMFHMFLVREINNSEKEILNKLFDKLGEIEIDSFSLEIDYSEEKEAEFIKLKFRQWQELKKDFGEIINTLKTNWKKIASKKEKSYFG